jgi:hypothetical protein
MFKSGETTINYLYKETQQKAEYKIAKTVLCFIIPVA